MQVTSRAFGRYPSADFDTAVISPQLQSSFLPHHLYRSYNLADYLTISFVSISSYQTPKEHLRRLAFGSLKGTFHATRPRRPSKLSSAKLRPREHIATSSTTSRLPSPALTSLPELESALFKLQQSTLDLHTTGLPHKDLSRALPFLGEDSTGSRHQSLVRLGFAPFKPP